MPVIKATDSPHTSLHRTAFNFDDLRGQAEQYLAEVRREAAQIIEKAKQDAIATKHQYEQQARQAAEQSVQQRVEQLAGEIVNQRLQTLRPALERAAAAIEKGRGDWTALWESQAVHLAIAIAQRVIRRELSKAPEIQVKYIEEALELVAGNHQVRVRIHPDDHQSLGGLAEHWITPLLARASAQLVPDARVSLGGCIVESQHGQIDQRIETQLARIEEELTRSS
jgi:flagellar biosynthesis/type III secretory pathway protein FliH